MRALILGSGGREHALAWKLAGEGVEVVCAPGNAGMASLGPCLEVDPADSVAVAELAARQGVDLVVVGPELPLCRGVVDELEARGVRAFGPGRAAAELEGSKVFAKEFMARHGIPTAPFEVFDDPRAARRYVERKGGPLVVKADGLAAGKGSIVAHGPGEALEALELIMERRAFGEAGRRVVVEEYLEGEEASLLVITDGEHALPLPAAQDHKRLLDGDRGPNTGGMGAYSPAPVVTPELLSAVMERVVRPTLRGMAAEGRPYRGVLYVGLMVVRGRPFVLEYNVRFGDPEAQPILVRMREPLVELLLAAREGRLVERPLRFDPRPAVCVVMASRGYPGRYERGKPIEGVERAESLGDVVVFHAGTALQGGRLVTAGGRVLGVTALGRDFAEAIQRAYRAVECIRFEGACFRRDIGHRALRR